MRINQNKNWAASTAISIPHPKPTPASCCSLKSHKVTIDQNKREQNKLIS